jgi:hypothetical protein
MYRRNGNLRAVQLLLGQVYFVVALISDIRRHGEHDGSAPRLNFKQKTPTHGRGLGQTVSPVNTVQGIPNL